MTRIDDTDVSISWVLFHPSCLNSIWRVFLHILLVWLVNYLNYVRCLVEYPCHWRCWSSIWSILVLVSISCFFLFLCANIYPFVRCCEYCSVCVCCKVLDLSMYFCLVTLRCPMWVQVSSTCSVYVSYVQYFFSHCHLVEYNFNSSKWYRNTSTLSIECLCI